MLTRIRPLLIRSAALTVVGLSVLAGPSSAQSPAALPTAPGADRAANGGLSEAHASLPGAPGTSPLEPYLVLWLLPVSGILTVAAAIAIDRRTLALPRRRR